MEPKGGGAMAFTISPDDRWMAFMEIDSMYPTAPVREGITTTHLVTMDLESLRKTHHTLDGFPRTYFNPSGRTWHEVLALFDVASWKDGRLILECCWGSDAPWMSITPGVVPVAVSKPEAGRSCSDCASSGLYERAARRFRWVSAINGEVSIPSRHASRSSNVYTIAFGHSNTIVRVDSSRRHEELVRMRHPRWKYHVSRIRVSPDERYLAFAVERVPLVSIPFAGRYEVYVMDTRSRRRARVVDDYDYVSRILWTSDSQRFYFGAIDQEHGIYVVDVADFNQSERGELQ